jgi:hypothetical protein
MMRVWSPLAGMLLTLLASPAHGATLDADPSGAVWIADARGVIKLDSRRARVLLEVREAPGTRALAVDREAGVLWAYSPGDLRAFDLSGRPLFAVPVPAGGGDGGRTAARPAAVAAGGSIWLADGRRLSAYDAAGQRLWSSTLAAPAVGLAVDASRGLLWVATAERVAAYGADDGYERLELALGERPQVVGITADPLSGAQWVAHAGRVQRHAPDGTRQLEIAANPADPLRAVVADGAGGAWVAGATWLAHLDAAGRVQALGRPFDGKGRLDELAADALSGEVWVARETELARVSAAGAVLRQLSFEPPLSILDLAFEAPGAGGEGTTVSSSAGRRWCPRLFSWAGRRRARRPAAALPGRRSTRRSWSRRPPCMASPVGSGGCGRSCSEP